MTQIDVMHPHEAGRRRTAIRLLADIPAAGTFQNGGTRAGAETPIRQKERGGDGIPEKRQRRQHDDVRRGVELVASFQA